MKRTIVIFLLAAAFLAACNPKNRTEPDDTPTSGVIAIAADETLAPIVRQEIAVFESIYKEAGIVPRFRARRRRSTGCCTTAPGWP